MPVRTIFDPHPDVGCSALAMTPDAKYIAAISAGKNQVSPIQEQNTSNSFYINLPVCLHCAMTCASCPGVGDLGLDGRERGCDFVCFDARCVRWTDLLVVQPKQHSPTCLQQRPPLCLLLLGKPNSTIKMKGSTILWSYGDKRVCAHLKCVSFYMTVYEFLYNFVLRNDVSWKEAAML